MRAVERRCPKILGALLLFTAAGCAGVAEAPPEEMAQAAPQIRVPDPVEANLNVAPAVAPPKLEPKEGSVALASAPADSRLPAKAARPSVKSPAKADVFPPSPAQARKVETPVPAPAAKAPEPSLDLAALTARLRDTTAIGTFTKLALKNQVDDLLKKFRAHYQGGQKTGVASLRQPYNMLLLKVLSLVQDSDPSLASAISGSREAIWGILADPEKFKLVA